MWLKAGNILLKREFDLQKIAEARKTLPEWQNLSERSWYPAGMPDNLAFTIEYEGKFVGCVELANIRWFNRKAEITIWILPEFRGKAHAKDALKGIVKLAFEQFNFHRLEAEVYEFNEKARNLFISAGFVIEGKLREAKYRDGRYYDIIRFGLLKREWKTD
ncbi:GNAT family N-acetyltransferase [Calditrichota bacterium LG25]